MNSAERHCPKSSRFFKTTAFSANTVTDCVNDSAGEWMSCSVKLYACSKQQSIEMLNVSSRHNQIKGEHIYRMKCCEFGGFACHR
jgi:hypothetical protein